MVTRATGEHDLRDVEVSASDRLMVQQVLALLARFGAQVHETFISRVDPAIVANPEILVITTLDVEGELRPSEIVELTGVSSSGATKLIDRLEGHGIVVRQVGTVPEDRRATRVVLTPEGQRAARQLAAGLASQMELVRALIAELQEVTDG
jgi:DNA-binding MarR family transcriptional regulator